MSSYRSQGRRLALQVLYAGDFNELTPESLEAFLETTAPKAPPEVRSYARRLVLGILKNKKSLDDSLASAAKHWKLDRIHPVERSILRIGLYEMFHCEDVPGRVAIDEALELAHRFGDEEAWRLVNGILDEIGHREGYLADTKNGDES